jgi:hypothetical protein
VDQLGFVRLVEVAIASLGPEIGHNFCLGHFALMPLYGKLRRRGGGGGD